MPQVNKESDLNQKARGNKLIYKKSISLDKMKKYRDENLHNLNVDQKKALLIV